LNTKVVC